MGVARLSIVLAGVAVFVCEAKGDLCRTTVDEGGETVFPNAQTKVSGPEWSDCAKQGLAVKTRRRDALLFFRYHLLGKASSRNSSKYSGLKQNHSAMTQAERATCQMLLSDTFNDLPAHDASPQILPARLWSQGW